jgi:hypothetical protein
VVAPHKPWLRKRGGRAFTSLSRLKTEWTQFVGANKSSCMVASTIGGFSSYVESTDLLGNGGRNFKSESRFLDASRSRARLQIIF